MATTFRILALVGGFALVSPPVWAAGTGWYGGINAGHAQADINSSRINTSLQSAGFATAGTTKDDRDFAYRLFGGYQFNRNFAVEGSYFDLGRFKYLSTTTGPAGTLNGQLKHQGVGVDAIGILPISDKWSALGRLGLTYVESSDQYFGTGGVVVTYPGASKRTVNYKLGLGLQYDLNPSVGLRGEVERYRVQDSAGNRGDVDVYSAGMVVKF